MREQGKANATAREYMINYSI